MDAAKIVANEPAVSSSATVGAATPQSSLLSAQQSSPDGSIPAADSPSSGTEMPANLAIPSAPEYAVPPPAAPDPGKVVVEAPPPPRPPTPAELLGLSGKDRAKAEKCLANAVYFESRGEPLRGQIAVAQVVMNRVFSPYYPKDVCSVVYQNAERHLACQFTFACDGKSKTIHDRGAWWRATRVAKQTLDGKVWLAAVAKSTHYHAYYVNPSWVSEMKKMFRFGVHTFYRPHRWGDGANEIGWANGPAPPLAPKPTPAAAKPANDQKAAIPAAPASLSHTTVKANTPTKLATAGPSKVDAKSVEAKAAATKNEAKTAASKSNGKTVPLKVEAKKSDIKKSDSKVSPIYTDGKRSDAKTAPAKNQQSKSSSKPAPKAQAKPSTKSREANSAGRVSVQ